MTSLDELVLDCLDRLEATGDDLETVLAAFAASDPEHADGLRRRIEALLRIGLLERPSVAGEPAPDRIGDFDLERRLGGGGMGVVYLATQRSMQRRVALKLVRPGHFFYEGTRARFRREAESAARLSHPNIVPVHTFGEEGGVPYLAMEYVRGASLDRVLAALCQREGPLRGQDFLAAVTACTDADRGELPPADATFFAGSATDVVLRITLAVARALAHAHERGVLQRDVKPSNVMLTADGRVLLLDFGLSSVSGGERVTRSGAMVGSLPTMAPEQVRGDPVDARTDVYGLGATMYELLTRRAPHLEPGNQERTRARILDGRPLPPRRIDPGIPRDAETVCLVAMDCDPARRYQSAESFAADLQNVIAQRPIHARPAGPLRHFERWARRRPGAATATLLALLLAVGGPVVFAWQSSRAQQRLQREVERADANFHDASVALQRADRNFDRMIDVLELVSRVARDDLADVPMAEQGRRDVLRGVADFFRQLAQESGAGEAFDLDRAAALTHLGHAQADLDEIEPARASLTAAEALFVQHGAGPGNPHAEDLAHVYWRLAKIDLRQGALAAALKHYEAALALLPDGPLDRSQSGLYRQLITSEVAHTHRLAGDMQAAHTLLAGVIAKLESCPLDHSPRLAELAAYCYGEATAVDARMGRGAERREGIERQLVLYEMLAAKSPGARVPRQKLLIALSNLGGVQLEAKEYAAGVATLERAAAIGDELIAEFPGIHVYRFNLAGVLVNLGGARLCVAPSPGEPPATEGGRKEFERAIAILEQLLVDDPGVTEYRTFYLSAASNLVAVLNQEGLYERALAQLDRIAPEYERMLQLLAGDRQIVMGRNVNALNRLRANLGLGRVRAACDAALAMRGFGDPFAMASAANELGIVLQTTGARSDHIAAARDTMLQLIEAAVDAGLETGKLDRFPRLTALDGEPRMAALRRR